ncbi:FtsK/SpoIIIE domain-containing protein (plasmid) [Streptomyces sp. NBC_01298]|uniref:helix-turn-helix domain-containing protein n=1 Tax=Streptomyces sp. NBC_01298 TaxID=2903817 RepID=UPI002E136BF5|nr:FtsK/SpoIIIE domain-containing protein [Streptomyces sp. NBC_01298]WSK26337.1 FtsK/SpoIIIE domain-containing protein [Streptomyces sp. NBC_01298]
MIARTRSGARHLSIYLAHWAGAHTVSNEELLRRIVKARAEAHQEQVEEHRRLARKAFKTVEKYTRIAEEDGGLTPSAKARLKGAKFEAERHSKALRALGEFDVPNLDPGQVRHRRHRIAAARCAILAAPAAGIVTLSATTTWWAAPAAAMLGAVGSWTRGPKPFVLTTRAVPAELIAETPLVIPTVPAAPSAGELLIPAQPLNPPTVGGAEADPDPEPLILAISEAMAACKVIPTGRKVVLLERPVVKPGEWSAVVRLPDSTGAEFADVLKARSKVAGELGLDMARLHVEPVPGADGKTVRLIGFDVDPLAQVRLCTAEMLADVDVWKVGIPVAIDVFGRLLYLRLQDVSLLLGGSTRSGKGAALRLIIAGCLLDPRVRLHLADGKHPGQNRWAGLVDTHIFEPKTRAEQLKNKLAALVAEMGSRAGRMATLGIESLAERPDLVGSEGLTLEVVVVDEVSVFTGDSKHGAAITRHLADLAQRGLAFGIILVLATQLNDTTVLPKQITGNVVWRWCMYTMDADESNTILGKGAAGRGWSTHLLDENQRGSGILRRGGKFTTLRSLWLDGSEMAAVQDMVRALRSRGAAVKTAPAPPASAVHPTDWRVLDSWLEAAAPAPAGPASADPRRAQALALIRQAGPEGIKRAAVADAIGASATTVGGWLKGWTEQGLIEALGASPHTRYAATDGRQ